jgi:hypothetical protein
MLILGRAFSYQVGDDVGVKKAKEAVMGRVIPGLGGGRDLRGRSCVGWWSGGSGGKEGENGGEFATSILSATSRCRSRVGFFVDERISWVT